jgi:hypothetical protein
MRVLLVLVFTLAFASSAHATTYVSTTGADTNPGTLASPVKTIVKGVQVSTDGDVQLAPGVYPAESRSLLRPTVMTTVSGAGAVVGGLNLKGAQNLTFDGLTFTGPVVFDARTDAGTDPSSNVAVTNSMLSATGNSSCVVIRTRASNVRITGNRIGPCFMGVVLPARTSTTLDSSNITVDANVIGPVESDCIQISDTASFAVSGNVCHDARDNDPSDGLEHNDAVQVPTGGHGGLISGNVLSTLTGQFPSAALQLQAGTHGSENITASNNAIGRTGSVSVQVGAVQGFVAEGNVACRSEADVGMWIRGGGSPTPPTDAIARWNVMPPIQAIEGAAWAEQTGNAVCP